MSCAEYFLPPDKSSEIEANCRFSGLGVKQERMRRRRRKEMHQGLLNARHGKVYEPSIDKMCKGLPEDEVDLISILKACGHRKDLIEGFRIHSHAIEMGFLEKNKLIGSAFVSMYAKCGAFSMAQELFDKLPVHDVVSWTALIGGYAQYGLGKEALDCFERMQGEGIFPNAVTFCCILKACGSINAGGKGREIHAEIAQLKLLSGNVILGTALVDMYAKCGELIDAQKVFDKLHEKDVISWTALLTGYVQHARIKEALECFEQMRQKGVCPNAVTFACILQACGSIGALEKGEEIHLEILRQDLQKDFVLGTALVDMYAKCGRVVSAQEVFDQLPVHNIISHSALISGYCLNGCAGEAFHHFEKMQQEGIFPNAVTLACMLKACGSVGEAVRGKEIHADIARRGLQERDCVLENSLIDMYMKCNALAMAHEVFNELSIQNLVSWNILISGYYQHDHCEEALDLFIQMQMEGHFPDKVTFRSILQVCSDIGARAKGKEIHVQILGAGYLGVVGTALVDMYAKCDTTANAKELFDELIAPDAETWNALIVGYCNAEYGEQALDCFRRMQLEGSYWDMVTLACILKVCGMLRESQKGLEIHSLIVITRWLETDTILGSALVDMYVRCGLLEKAQEVFDKLPILDEVSWTALISAYCQHGRNAEALDCFNRMQFEGLSPDSVTFSCILQVCCGIGALRKGQEIHGEIVRKGILGNDTVLGVGLVHMYGRSGALLEAKDVFNRLPNQDVVSWTALIAGYAQNGGCETVFELFNKMVGIGTQPNSVTFIAVLNACCFSGLVEKGRMFFDAMTTSFGIFPTLEHHTCMVDLLGRVGYFESAMKAIHHMPCCDHLPMWFALLGASEKWGNVEFGRLAYKHAIQLDKSGIRSGLAYSYMYSILCRF